MILKKGKILNEERGLLVVSSDDKIARADARLVSLITKITRELKNKVASTYFYEDTYKHDTAVLNFNWADRDKIVRIVRMCGFIADVNE